MRQFFANLSRFYSRLNETELVILFVIFLAQFSLWPTFDVPGFGGSSFEPAMLVGPIAVIYALKKYGLQLVTDLFHKPTFWILLWFAYVFVLALATTDRLDYITVRSGQVISVVAAGFIVAIMHARKDIKLTTILDGWIYLALILTPIYLLQYVLASLGVDVVAKEAYEVGVFSFPRLHGFSFEPLFFANWLLVPLLYAVYRAGHRCFFAISTILSTLLFLTLARGAIYGVIIALILLFVLSPARKRFAKKFVSVGLGLVISLVFVGFSAGVNGDNPIHGVGRFMDHMANGVFNTGGSSSQTVRTVQFRDKNNNLVTRRFVDTKTRDSSGAVEGSGLSRLEAIRTGFDVFAENPATGTGLLRFGEEARELYPTVYNNDDSVTNSLPVDVLVEGGLIGVTILSAFAVAARQFLFRVKSFVFVVVVALAVQSLFFSNYSILPFWIMLGVAMNDVDEKLRFG